MRDLSPRRRRGVARHPLVIVSSSNGHAIEALPAWQLAADTLDWIVVASDNFRDGPYSERDHALQMETVALVEHDYQIDRARVYLAGMAGAAMHAFDLAGDEPDVFRGVIANTGVMPHHRAGNAAFDARAYPRDKLAVLLASPTDGRYQDMKADRALLEAQGWQVAWFEFAGGHQIAPPLVYALAAAWLAGASAR